MAGRQERSLFTAIGLTGRDERAALGKEAGEVELFADAPDAMRFRILLQEQAWQNEVEAVLA